MRGVKCRHVSQGQEGTARGDARGRQGKGQRFQSECKATRSASISFENLS